MATKCSGRSVINFQLGDVEMDYKDYLQHWGIAGMKWGQRNGPPYPLSSKQMNSSERKQNAPRKKVGDMSDEELEARLKRLRKEDEYNRLTTPKKKEKSELMKQFEKQVISVLLAGAITGLGVKAQGEQWGKQVKEFVEDFLKRSGSNSIDFNFDAMDIESLRSLL